MLRYARDIQTLGHVALSVLFVGLALAHSLWWAPLAVFVGMHLIAVEHNHAHVPVFRWGWLNAVLDHLLFVLCGIPVIFWRVHHLGSHHKHTWTENDWSSPFNFRSAATPNKPISYRYYKLTYLPLFVFHSSLHILRTENRRQLRSLVVTLVLFAGVTFLLIDGFGVWRWLIVMGTTYLAAGQLLGAANYLEHYNTFDRQGSFLAWTFVCPIHNFLAYNSGFHLLHHEQPTLHWSRLPEAHRDCPSYSPPELIEDGLFPAYRGPKGLKRWLDQHA